MMPMKTLPDCVKWTGPYISVDNTKGTEGEHKGLVFELVLMDSVSSVEMEPLLPG